MKIHGRHLSHDWIRLDSRGIPAGFSTIVQCCREPEGAAISFVPLFFYFFYFVNNDKKRSFESKE